MEYLYETHLHTCQASACGKSTGAEHVRYYHSIGFKGIFITDHFFGGNSCIPRNLPWKERIRRYRAGFDDAWNEGQKCGLDVFFGWEETFQGDDYLVYGLSPEWMEEHPEMERWTHREQFEAVRAAGGCVVQAHPYRCRDYIHIITLNKDYVDAVEVANAGNRAIEDAMAIRYAEKYGLYQTCGSDNHHSRDGLLENGRIFGMALNRRLTGAADYARVIREREPVRLNVPADRFKMTDDMIPLRAFWIDAGEQRTPVDQGGSEAFAGMLRALASGYESIYDVDALTGRYVRFGERGRFNELLIEKSGDDFFTDMQNSIEKMVHEEDRSRVLQAMKKETILSQISSGKPLSVTCRMLKDEGYSYFNITAARDDTRSGLRLVVGVCNLGAQIDHARELAIARERVYRDALTGVKSKHAYVEAEEALDRQLAAGTAGAFAIVMCDINNLKRVNDTMGHAAGDVVIRKASALICETFKHSPVYRYGGDEFVVILRGQDYENRQLLIETLKKQSGEQKQEPYAQVACGAAVYDPENDRAAADVFNRADSAMYENKKKLKKG